VSGATTATIVERFRVLIRKLPPQLVGLPRDADLVTITAGGNDLRYRELIYI
jgi:lysophospholipase L1-like esterase